jgi:hypothetical protein
MPRPIIVNAVGKPIIIFDAATFAHPALLRGLMNMLCLFDGGPPRFLVDEFAVRQLLADNVDFLDVRQALRPFAGLQADDAAHDFGDALNHYQRAGNRNNGLEGIDRRSAGRHRVLANMPGEPGVIPAGIHHGEDTWREEQEVERQVERGLGARLHVAIQEVAANMPVLRQRVGAAHHEQRTVDDVIDVEDPRRRCVQDVALEHFDADNEREDEDQPGKELARPIAELVYTAQEALDCHDYVSLKNKNLSGSSAHKKARHQPVRMVSRHCVRPYQVFFGAVFLPK